MTLAEFERSLKEPKPPHGLAPALLALWWAGKDDWDAAHRLVMAAGADCAWVHAYLHRAEGDLTNARYWYAQAGRSVAANPLEAEWQTIVGALLARHAAA